MSAPAGTIARAQPSEPGLNYSALVAEGTRLVQQLSGAIWTDYNYSDPGVTILEQLCYALTELSYRADFPVQDLLGAPGSGHVALPRQGLYPARAIMPINPVTPNDLRRLIIDRVPQVGNAWFTPVPAHQAHGVSGLYRIAVTAPAREGACECSNDDTHALVQRVLDCYGAHRALCEDVQACCVLKPIPTRVRAEVHLDDHTDPDQVLAQLQFALGLALMPEPLRTSLDQQLAAGYTTAEIFNGPLMLRGFIADDQLQPLPRQVAVEHLLEVMVAVPGVLSVERLSVRVGDDPRGWRVGEQIDLPQDHILHLEPHTRDGAQTLRLWYAGSICSTHAARVQRLLERAWAAQRRTYALWAEYGKHYRPPTGQGWDLSAYSSIQEQFPAVYGIGTYGLPSSAPVPRQAQAKQLKGYLMPFDQLMANYFSQLAFVRELFSVRAGGDQTYAVQSLRGIVPNVAPLLQPGYDQDLAALSASRDPVLERQSGVLDFLLSLYAQTLTLPSPSASNGRQRHAQSSARLKAKQALLARLVPATRDRGRALDYRRGGLGRGMAGLEIRCRIELALLDAQLDGKDAEPVPGVDHTHLEQRLPAKLGQLSLQHQAGGGRPDLYIVEWVLLRHDESAYAQETSPANGVDPFSFRVSAVMPARDRDEVRDEHEHEREHGHDHEHEHEDPNRDGWRRQARAIVRENMPAHILVEDVFLGPHRMKRFVRLYDEWVDALRHGPATRRAQASRHLAHFLRPPVDRARAPVAPAPDAGFELNAGFELDVEVDAEVDVDVEIEGSLASMAGLEPVTAPAVAPAIAPAAAPQPAQGDLAATAHPLIALPASEGQADATPAPASAPVGAPAALPAAAQAVPAAPPQPIAAAIESVGSHLPAEALNPAEPCAGVPAPTAPSPSKPSRAATHDKKWWQFWRRPTPAPTAKEPTAIPSTPSAAAPGVPAPGAPAQNAPAPGLPLGLPRVDTVPPTAASEPAPAPAPEPAPTPTPAPAPMPPEAAAPSTTTLPGHVQAAPPGARGIDTATQLTASTAQAFASAGFVFAIRYLTRNGNESSKDLSTSEATQILQAGLALMAVQHVATAGWTPSAALGTQYGDNAAANAKSIGLPSGVNLWLDLEGVAAGTPSTTVAAYCNAWYDAVAQAGYLPGLYVGSDAILNGTELYSQLQFQRYWRSGSTVPEVATRGYCMVQTIGSSDVIDGVSYDLDVIEADHMGDTPFWLQPLAGAEPT